MSKQDFAFGVFAGVLLACFLSVAMSMFQMHIENVAHQVLREETRQAK